MLTNSMSATAPRTIGVMLGSTRPGSFNARLADQAVQVIEQDHLPHRTVVLDGLEQLPFYTEDADRTPPPAVTQLRERVAQVDALLVVTPEYNGAMPAVLKNAVDWLSRPRGRAVIMGLPAAVIGASPSPGGAARARANGQLVLQVAQAQVLPDSFGVALAASHGEELNADSRGELSALLRHLVDTADQRDDEAAA